MTAPIALTCARIVLGPLFMFFYLYFPMLNINMEELAYLLIAIALISELSDLFDGYLARRNNQVTELGKLLDPMADTIFRLSVFFTLTQGPVDLPLLLVIVLFYREMIITTLRTVCALRGVALAARLSGKVKAVIQAIVVFFILIMLIPYSQGAISKELLQAASFYSLLAATAYTIFTGIEYIAANRKYIKKAIRP